MPKVLRLLPFWPTFISSICFIITMSLGTWQIQRLEWKTALITAIQSRQKLPPESLSKVDQNHLQDWQFRIIQAKGHFENDRYLKLIPRLHDGQNGYHLIVSFLLENGQRILVDRGWMPINSSPYIAESSESILIEGILNLSQKPGYFSPPPNIKRNEIYNIEPKNDLIKIKFPDLLPFYLVQTKWNNDYTFPIISKTSYSLPNNHLLYAIIWYSLSIIIIIIYLVYLRHKIV